MPNENRSNFENYSNFMTASYDPEEGVVGRLKVDYNLPFQSVYFFFQSRNNDKCHTSCHTEKLHQREILR